MEQTVQEHFKISEWLPFFQSHAFLQSMMGWHIKEGGSQLGEESEGQQLPCSDPCQLMPQTGWQDAFYFLHDKVQGGKQSAEELQRNQKDTEVRRDLV